MVGVRGGGAGGGRGGGVVRRRARRRCGRRRPGAALGRRQQRVLPGHGLRQEPEGGRAEDVHRQGRDQDRREEAHLREREQRRLRARVDRSSTSTPAGSSSRARARPRSPQQYPRRTAAQRDAADEERGLHARPDARRRSSASRSSVPTASSSASTVHAAAGLSERHEAAGALLVLSARVRRSGRLRPARPHVQQELVPDVRHALDGVLHRASATPSSSPTRRSSARPGR